MALIPPSLRCHSIFSSMSAAMALLRAAGIDPAAVPHITAEQPLSIDVLAWTAAQASEPAPVAEHGESDSGHLNNCRCHQHMRCCLTPSAAAHVYDCDCASACSAAALRILIAAAARGHFLTDDSASSLGGQDDDDDDGEHHDVQPVQDKHVTWLRRKLAQLSVMSTAVLAHARSLQRQHRGSQPQPQLLADARPGHRRPARAPAAASAASAAAGTPPPQLTRSRRPVKWASHPLHRITVAWDSRISDPSGHMVAPPPCVVLLRPQAR